MDMMENKDNNKDNNNNNNIKNPNCQYIFESFQNCMHSTNNTELCKPQLDLFNFCNKKV